MDIVRALADNYNQQPRPRVSLVTRCSRTATRSAVSSSAGTSELVKKTIAAIVVFVGAYHIVCIDTIVSEFDDFDQRDEKFTVHRVFSVDQIGVFALKTLSPVIPEIIVPNIIFGFTRLSLHSRKHNVSICPRTSSCQSFPKEASQSALTVDHKTIGYFARDIYTLFLPRYFNSSSAHFISVITQYRRSDKSGSGPIIRDNE